MVYDYYYGNCISCLLFNSLTAKKIFFFEMQGIIYAIIISCALQALYGILQYLSGSRAGVLSIFMLVAIWGYQSVSWNKLQKIVLVIGVLVVLIVFLYFLKRNSADGRLLIWICCLNMIAIKPWFGFGSGGFEAHYICLLYTSPSPRDTR